jgi:hypothetical protein
MDALHLEFANGEREGWSERHERPAFHLKTGEASRRPLSHLAAQTPQQGVPRVVDTELGERCAMCWRPFRSLDASFCGRILDRHVRRPYLYGNESLDTPTSAPQHPTLQRREVASHSGKQPVSGPQQVAVQPRLICRTHDRLRVSIAATHTNEPLSWQ